MFRGGMSAADKRSDYRLCGALGDVVVSVAPESSPPKPWNLNAIPFSHSPSLPLLGQARPRRPRPTVRRKQSRLPRTESLTAKLSRLPSPRPAELSRLPNLMVCQDRAAQPLFGGAFSSRWVLLRCWPKKPRKASIGAGLPAVRVLHLEFSRLLHPRRPIGRISPSATGFGFVEADAS